jgi:hypothetical protein
MKLPDGCGAELTECWLVGMKLIDGLGLKGMELIGGQGTAWWL